MKKYKINGHVVIADSIDEAMCMHKAISSEEPEINLQYLIDDEIEAIEGYRKMIAKCNNPALLSVLSHILKEETEHVEELRLAQSGVYKKED